MGDARQPLVRAVTASSVSPAVEKTPPDTEASATGMDESPAGFHHPADASSATATNAPPIPCARLPTTSKSLWAAAGTADPADSVSTRRARAHGTWHRARGTTGLQRKRCVERR